MGGVLSVDDGDQLEMSAMRGNAARCTIDFFGVLCEDGDTAGQPQFDHIC
jgi:hypothetical protein